MSRHAAVSVRAAAATAPPPPGYALPCERSDSWTGARGWPEFRERSVLAVTAAHSGTGCGGGVRLWLDSTPRGAAAAGGSQAVGGAVPSESRPGPPPREPPCPISAPPRPGGLVGPVSSLDRPLSETMREYDNRVAVLALVLSFLLRPARLVLSVVSLVRAN